MGGGASGFPPGGLHAAGDAVLCLTEPGIGYLAVLEFDLGIEAVAHTAAGIAEQYAFLLRQRRQMGVPVEHQLDIQFQRPAAQGQQRGLDAVSMPMGEQNPYAVQFQQAFGFAGFAPVAVAQHGNEPLVQQIGGTFGVPDAVAAEQLAVRLRFGEYADGIFQIAMAVAEYGEFHKT